MSDHESTNDEPTGAAVDQQDGGPGSHDSDGGAENDVASGGTSSDANKSDVHGDADTVSGARPRERRSPGLFGKRGDGMSRGHSRGPGSPRCARQ